MSLVMSHHILSVLNLAKLRSKRLLISVVFTLAMVPQYDH
jgi:hypothetical protein